MESPGMGQFFNQGMMLQEALTSQYSVLHQERTYLLNVLAEEENQGEQLTHSLSALEAQINEHEGADPPLSTKKLKQQIKAVRSKIGACQHREKAVAANLANVVAQMEGVKRYKWRNAQQEYAMQIQQAQQHAQMVLMSPARPSFALRSPGPMDLASQMQYMSLGHPVDAPLPQQPPLNPYTAALSQPVPAWRLAVPFVDYAQARYPYSNGPPVWGSLEAYGGLTEAQFEPDQSMSPMSAISPGTSPSVQDWGNGSAPRRRQRAVSLLMPAKTYATSEPIPLSPTKPINDGAMRRLSLLDGTSAAIQMERKAAEARASMLTEGQ